MAVIVMFFMMISGPVGAVQTDKKNVGEVAGSFLDLNPSVRMSALGGDQVTAHGSLDSLFSNPAGLQSMMVPELYLTHHQALVDSNSQTLGFGVPTKNHAFGVAVQYLNDGTQDKVGIDSGNEPVFGLGDVNFSTLRLQAGWATKMTSRISVGVAMNGWRESRDISSSEGWAMDGGVQVRSALPSLDLGMAVKNLGPNVDGSELPTGSTLGFSYHLNRIKFLSRSTLYSELDYASHRDLGLRAGLEYAADFVWLRGGYQNLTSELDDPISQFSFGGGLRIKGLKLDYAWIPGSELGDQHKLGLTLGFGLTPEDRDRQARQLDNAMEKQMQANAEAQFGLGTAAMNAGAWSKAQDHFSQVLTWDPGHTEAHAQLKVAEDKLHFSKAQGHYQKGQNQLRNKQWLDAAYEFQQTLNLVPTHKKAQSGLKKAQRNIRSTQKTKNQKSTWDVVYERGTRHYIEGKYGEALAEWNRLLKNRPTYPKLGEYIEKAQKMIVTEELHSLKAKTTSQDKAVLKMSQQAYTFYMLGQVDQAIGVWKKIVVLDPTNQDAKSALKNAREKKDLVKQDTDGYASRRILELNAKAFRAYNAGHLRKTVSIFRQALLLDPTNRRIQNNINRVENELAGHTGDEVDP